jgi:hypothetical protein
MTTKTLSSLSPLKLEALEVYAGLTAVFQEHQGGWADTEALREVQKLCFRLIHGQTASIAAEADRVRTYAAVLYSARRHEKYTQRGIPYVDGVERVRGILLQIMQALKSVIRGME